MDFKENSMMKRRIFTILLLPVLFSWFVATAQDTRQREVKTIVQDVLAQLPVQSSEDFDKEISDIALSAPESVEILASMLPGETGGLNSKVEYALNGTVVYVSRTGNESYAEAVKDGLSSGLAGCTDAAGRSFLLSQLSLIADEDDIPVFLEYVDDPISGSVAIGALISIPESDDALMELVRKDAVSRPLLAYAVAEKNLSEAEPYLISWIEELGEDHEMDSDPSSSHDTPDMRTYLHSLACCGSVASLKILEENSIYDYVTLLKRLSDSPDRDKALSCARKLLKSEDICIRTSALSILVSSEGKDALKYVVSALKSSDAEYRNAALGFASGFSSDTDFCKKLSAVLSSGYSDEKKADIVRWAGRNKAVSLQDDIISLLPYDGCEQGDCLSEAAIVSAGLIGGEKAAVSLISMLGSRYSAQAYNALLSFDGDISSHLGKALDAGNVARQNALKLIAGRRMHMFADNVFGYLDDDDPVVRKAAEEALQGVVSENDCERLNVLLASSSEDNRISFQNALCASLGKLPAEEQYGIVEKYIEEGNRASLYYPVLAQAADCKSSLNLLKDGYESGDEPDQAFASLMGIENYNVADVLLDIALHDPYRKTDALRRYVYIVSKAGIDDVSAISKYYYIMGLDPGAPVKNDVLKALAAVDTMPAFMLASEYLDDPETAYQAANAVKAIASSTEEEIDYRSEKESLEKAMSVFASAGGADNGYAVDEIRKMLSGLQPPAEKFVLPEDEAEAGFEILFDGTDLSKWVGDKVGYAPVNGTISVSAGYGNARNLYTAKEYKDFIFRFEFCFLKPGVNNGVGIRTPMDVDAAYWGMCEVQILDHDDPIYKDLNVYQVHGSAYGIIPARRVVHKPLGEWNTEEIKVIGDHITVTLNGEVILDGNLREACKGHNIAPDGGNYNPYTVDHLNHPGMFNEKGHISFCGHGAGIKFRNIRILDLDK